MMLLYSLHCIHYVLAPLHCIGVQEMYETVACIFERKPNPAVVATVNVTQDAHGQVVRPGTVLFPRQCEKILKTKLKSFQKKGEVANIEFTTTLGTNIYLPMDCAAGFSTQVEDLKLYLPELMAHLTLPVEVKCFAQEHSRHCNKMSNITLTKVCTEASITGGLTLEGSKVKDQQFDLPLDLPVKVACIDLAKERLQRSLYARVKSTYESVDHRLAANKTIVVNGDARDKAQQEFYSAVRTDIAQDVVTVDVPERIYDEVGFASGKRTSTTSAGVQHFNSAGARAVPRHPVPLLPPHCHERSKDEPYEYVEMMRKTPANASITSTPSAPLPCKKHDAATVPAAIDIYDEPTAPPSSTHTSHTHREAASKMPGLGNSTAALTMPSLPAQDKKQKKRTPPPLHSKPLRPVLLSPPPTLPQRQADIYDDIQPYALTASVYTPMVHDKPTRLPPAPAPKPASFKRAHTQPQLQVQAEGSNPIQVDEAGNIQYLKTLSCNDIIRLLEAMELPQYIDSFMKVSGTVEHTP